MTHVIHVHNEQPLPIPSLEQLQSWAHQTLAQESTQARELGITIVTPEAIQQLNNDYRGKNKPTNVLSFAADLPPELGLPELGDIVICAAVVAREASEYNLALDMRWAHMVVHGTLHLLGYDHIDADEALEMEAKETRLIESWGYNRPYEILE